MFTDIFQQAQKNFKYDRWETYHLEALFPDWWDFCSATGRKKSFIQYHLLQKQEEVWGIRLDVQYIFIF